MASLHKVVRIHLFYCESCKLPAHSEQTLLLHKKQCHTNTVTPVVTTLYPCDECSVFFKTRGNLKRHFESMSHTKKQRYQCDNCDAEFYYKADLASHRKSIHFTSQFVCDICDYQAGRKEHLEIHNFLRHVPQGEKKPLKCDVCDKVYFYHEYLSRHVKRQHSSVTFACPECDKTFKTECQLRRHRKTIHLSVESLKCPECDKSFKTKRCLKLHVESEHLGLKPFKCDKCSAAFVIENRLNVHKKQSHHKAWKCDHCYLTFGNQSKLKRHIDSVHLGLKPFACNLCNFETARKTCLITHTNRHHHSKQEKKF